MYLTSNSSSSPPLKQYIFINQIDNTLNSTYSSFRNFSLLFLQFISYYYANKEVIYKIDY